MRRSTLSVLRRGVEAAMVASVPQVLIAKLEEHLFLDGESADLGLHLIEALGRRFRRRVPEDLKWLAASAFHFGYAAAWGGAYALLYERKPVSPLLGGLLLGGVIYGVTFPPWGGAVLLGSEEPPKRRSARMELVMSSAAFTFGFGTALLYGRGPEAVVPEPETRLAPAGAGDGDGTRTTG